MIGLVAYNSSYKRHRMVEEKGKKEHRCHLSSELKFLLGEPHIQLTYHFNLLDHGKWGQDRTDG